MFLQPEDLSVTAQVQVNMLTLHRITTRWNRSAEIKSSDRGRTYLSQMGVSQGPFGLCVCNDHFHPWKDLQQQTDMTQLTEPFKQQNLLQHKVTVINNNVYMTPYLARLHQWQTVW